MQRLFNLSKWAVLEEGKAISFKGSKPRLVRLEVNSPGEVFLYVAQESDITVDSDPEVIFLARVCGRDTLEWHVAGGGFTLMVEGGSCNVYTIDGDDPSYRNLTPTIFTKIVERRPRNPEFERMAALMQLNVERRLLQQKQELNDLFRLRPDPRRVEPAAPRVPEPAGQPPEQDAAAPDDGGAEDPPPPRKKKGG